MNSIYNPRLAERTCPPAENEPRTDESAIGVAIRNIGRKTRNLLAGAGLLVLGAASSIAPAACRNNTPPEPSAPADAGPQKAEKRDRQFNPETYAPPEEGQIMYKKILPGNEKTIVYITDRHAFTPIMRDWQQSSEARETIKNGIAAQKEIFRIVEKAIADYGRVPLLLEPWIDYGPDSFFRNIREDRDEVMEIALTKDRQSRIDAANRILGRLPFSASALLPAVYQQEIIPIPAASRAQQTDMMSKAMKLDSLTDTYLAKDGKCSEMPFVRSGKTMSETTARFERSEHTPDILQCYCTYHFLGNEISNAFYGQREITAATEEARRADAIRTPVIFVIAGANHVSSALRFLRGRKTNVIVVAPNSVSDVTRTALGRRINHIPWIAEDDAKGSCAKWAQTHADSLDKTRRQLNTNFLHHAEIRWEELDAEWAQWKAAHRPTP